MQEDGLESRTSPTKQWFYYRVRACTMPWMSTNWHVRWLDCLQHGGEFAVMAWFGNLVQKIGSETCAEKEVQKTGSEMEVRNTGSEMEVRKTGSEIGPGKQVHF